MSGHTETALNQRRSWKKRFATFSSPWVKQCRNLTWDVKVGDTVRIIDGAFTDYTGKITEIDNNKVKMIISMFGNDTVAEVNLSQIAEL